MAWMKIDLELPDKTEVHGIAGITGLDADAVVGKLIRVWQWFDKHTVDGVAPEHCIGLLERLASCNGFCAAMIQVGWLKHEYGKVVVPKFEKHNGETAKRRAETALRVTDHRKRASNEKSVTPVTREWVSRNTVRAVKQRDNCQCLYCGRPEGWELPTEPGAGVIHIDHVIPVSRGGTNDEMNLVCACSVCNLVKSDKTPDEAGLVWPVDEQGNKFGVTGSLPTTLPREEKEKEYIAPKRARRKKSEKTGLPDDFALTEDLLRWGAEKGHSFLEERFDHFVRTARAKNYVYADWAQAFQNAVIDDWAKINSRKVSPILRGPRTADGMLIQIMTGPEAA